MIQVAYVCVAMALAALSARLPVLAQVPADEEIWALPVNLSRSGAASMPVIVPRPDGEVLVFWWDSINGLAMAAGRTGAWSEPVWMPLYEPETPEAASRTATPVRVMPHIINDASGSVYALWNGQTDTETGATPLLLARLDAAGSNWSEPRAIVESSAGFALIDDPDGVLHLAYIRNVHTNDAPSGIYIRSSDDGGATWTRAQVVHSSLYYRVISTEDLGIRLAAGTEGRIEMTWNDPQQGRAFHAQSMDGGRTWSEPQRLGSDKDLGVNARPMIPSGDPLNNSPFLLWEGNSGLGECALYQASTEGVTAGDTATVRVLEGLHGCPSMAGDRILLLDPGKLILLTGGGTETLTLSAWNGAAWSQPKPLSFRFTDLEAGTTIYLNGLNAALLPAVADEEEADEDQPSSLEAAAPTLAVVGVDANNDVWFTESRLEAFDLVYAAPTPWSLPQALPQSTAQPDLATLALDAEGSVHALWAEPESASGAAKVLRYARWSGTGWTRVATVLRSSEGSAVEPSIAVAADRLHAVWSDGPNGQVLYSRAFLRDAQAASGWDEPLPLPGPTTERGVGSRPQILASTVDGRLHAIYAVPLNEDRGIYTTSSEDAGVTWADAAQVFDAAGAGWAAVDSPRLAVDALGGLHAVWTRSSLAPDAPSLGVYYAFSLDGGRTWSEPELIADGNFDCADVVTDAVGGVALVWSQASGTRAWWFQWTPGTADVAQGTAEWTRAARIPGFSNVDCPLGIVSDGALAVQIVGLGLDNAGEGALLRQTWTLSLEPAAEGNEAGDQIEGRWGELETFRPYPAPNQEGMVAVLQPDTGRLDVLYRADIAVGDGDAQPGQWHTSRTVTVTTLSPEARPLIALRPTSTPTATHEVTDEPVPEAPPSQTDLAAGPPPLTEAASGTTQSIIVSAGIAAVIVGAAFGTRLLLKRQR